MSKTPSKAPSDQFEDLSLQEIEDVLKSKKRALGPVVAFSTHIQWQDGMPKVVGIPIKMAESPAERILETLKISLDLPYDGNDPSLANLTMGEAMVVQEARKAAHGDSAAFERIMNRLVGAPIQKSQNVNLNANLGDFLDKVSAQTKEVAIDITAEVKPDPDPQDVSDL
jgi:hypothetical protein